jgi:tetrapyrrole methylase family protein/MazG family protein
MSREFQNLVKTVKLLRSDKGCPWDRRQRPKDIINYLEEELAELKEALRKKNISSIKEELGDLLLLVVFLAQIYREKNKFNIHMVIQGLIKKLKRRHTWVFGNEKITSARRAILQWYREKEKEKSSKRR